MRSAERAVWIVVTALLVGLVVAARRTEAPTVAAAARARSTPGTRISMAALHQQGGVPLGWQPSVPPGDVAAGRAHFERLGCPACHHVAGEKFANGVLAPRGPELTGMGSHHPAAYFAEAILDPDAVLIDEPGWIGEDGRSIMPVYDEMTLGELADLVAYLGSLRDGASPSCHAGGASGPSTALAMTRVDGRDRPPPPPTAARVFFAQSYDVLPEKLPELERWFASEGRAAFGETQGLVSMETFVDVAKPAGALTTVFGFRDEAALRTFVGDPAMVEVWKRFDALIGPHGHVASDRPLVYPVASLSMTAR
jgi:hypothetical protein